MEVSRPATLGDGIERWDAEALNTLVQKWENEPSMRKNCGLWVPSSGAATRMFGSIKNDATMQERLWKLWMTSHWDKNGVATLPRLMEIRHP